MSLSNLAIRSHSRARKFALNLAFTAIDAQMTSTIQQMALTAVSEFSMDEAASFANRRGLLRRNRFSDIDQGIDEVRATKETLELVNDLPLGVPSREDLENFSESLAGVLCAFAEERCAGIEMAAEAYALAA
ncbi:hypothetical protein [Microvirga tunisiensis]|uniref:Uncharacterized protein n=1 Tax=Microvirga tunisiensis TaxID=2108360 RepID=A0A5N7MTE5_9HYPH|nr:hypothetical protein [Microvirga tunisiensis]MPR12192.1 hypothetical protein [Microvirga tunisiensis]MPR30138.1 hypothetical protein [Microvirga tunisiensis]